MTRVRAGLAIAVCTVVVASLYLVLFVDEAPRLRIWPWLWIALTAGIGVAHRRLTPDSPDRSFSLQAWLLSLALTLLFGVLLVPRDPEWIQLIVGGSMVVPLVALLRVRRRESGSKGPR